MDDMSVGLVVRIAAVGTRRLVQREARKWKLENCTRSMRWDLAVHCTYCTMSPYMLGSSEVHVMLGAMIPVDL
jgi:hypothetical protein